MNKPARSILTESSLSPERIKDVSGLIRSSLHKEMPEQVLDSISRSFMIGLSPHLVELIHKTGLDGPIARQYLPDMRELLTLPGEEFDPIGDGAHSPVPGIVHRYPDRVLLKIASVCAVYCRFCFRRELLGPKAETLSSEDLRGAIAYIKSHSTIREVILTGGDPMILSPARLRGLIEALNQIDHVRIVRIHTRIPIADPARVDDALIDALATSAKSLYVCLHINHPAEIAESVEAAVGRLRAIGASLLSQSVLLKGVNDSADILADLMQELVRLHVIPYEIHHPDMTRGTGHFRLGLERGREIVGALRGHISGLCQPHYMLDIPGGFGKVEVLSTNVLHKGDGVYQVKDYKGNFHEYRDF